MKNLHRDAKSQAAAYIKKQGFVPMELHWSKNDSSKLFVEFYKNDEKTDEQIKTLQADLNRGFTAIGLTVECRRHFFLNK